jgi:hypothetical protein
MIFMAMFTMKNTRSTVQGAACIHIPIKMLDMQCEGVGVFFCDSMHNHVSCPGGGVVKSCSLK